MKLFQNVHVTIKMVPGQTTEICDELSDRLVLFSSLSSTPIFHFWIEFHLFFWSFKLSIREYAKPQSFLGPYARSTFFRLACERKWLTAASVFILCIFFLLYFVPVPLKCSFRLHKSGDKAAIIQWFWNMVLHERLSRTSIFRNFCR